MKKPENEERTKLKRDASPEVPLPGNLTFLKLVDKLLTPEEIKAAVEAGKKQEYVK